MVRMIPKEYRKRWGIETSFRKVKEVYGRTLSPLTCDKACIFHDGDDIIYNLWQAINLILRIEEHGPTTQQYHVTMPLMVTIVCAHLNGRR